MTGDERARPTEHPAPDARPALSRAVALRRRLLLTAEAIAESEDQVSATLERMAAQRPDDAARLRAKSALAAQVADRERRWAADCRRRMADDLTPPPGERPESEPPVPEPVED